MTQLLRDGPAKCGVQLRLQVRAIPPCRSAGICLEFFPDRRRTVSYYNILYIIVYRVYNSVPPKHDELLAAASAAQKNSRRAHAGRTGRRPRAAMPNPNLILKATRFKARGVYSRRLPTAGQLGQVRACGPPF